jgi:bifunctional DNA-binding transcriptional regulator/antitoxin component of YhaV-PrlF toxin-antitoxin module
MEKLVVDAEGKLTIPPHILAKRGLRPCDELTLIEADEGLLIYQPGLDPLTARWWNGLNDDERRQAQVEAARYESLSEAERDQLWNEGTESIEEDAAEDEDEVNLTSAQGGRSHPPINE